MVNTWHCEVDKKRKESSKPHEHQLPKQLALRSTPYKDSAANKLTYSRLVGVTHAATFYSGPEASKGHL